MNNLHHYIPTLMGVLALILTSHAAAEERQFTRLERDLQYLMDILPGTFDNQEQISFDSAATAAQVQPGKLGRVHIRFKRAPELGEYVLREQVFINDDLDQVHRERMLMLNPDEKTGAIRAKSFAILQDGSEADLLTEVEGCDRLIRRDGLWFEGRVDDETCPATEGEVLGQASRFRVSRDQLWVGQASRDEFAETNKTQWRQLERARWFACMVDFPREPGGRPVVTHHYIKVHDQGGVFTFTHPDGRDMVLLMRNTWSYGMRRETFFIGVLDGSIEGETLVYSWGQPGADRIGVNPGYLRIQCDLDTPENVQMQHWLRPDS